MSFSGTVIDLRGTVFSGVPMATRSGDLDPGLVVHWLRTEGLASLMRDLSVRHSDAAGVAA